MLEICKLCKCYLLLFVMFANVCELCHACLFGRSWIMHYSSMGVFANNLNVHWCNKWRSFCIFSFFVNIIHLRVFVYVCNCCKFRHDRNWTAMFAVFVGVVSASFQKWHIRRLSLLIYLGNAVPLKANTIDTLEAFPISALAGFWLGLWTVALSYVHFRAM